MTSPSGASIDCDRMRPHQRPIAAVLISGFAALALAAVTGCAPQPQPVAQPPMASLTAEAVPEDFGAAGDGTTDDTAELQGALDSLQPGGTLWLPPGKVYRHSDVLTIATPGVTVAGEGTLLATNEELSAVYLAADDISVDGPTLAVADTSRRWTTLDQMKLRLGPFDGISVRNVTIDGSAAAGLYVGGANNFTVSHIIVRNTRADGIHITGGATSGLVTHCRVVAPGDDGVAVTSYRNDGRPVRDITVQSTGVRDQIWGRGFSVVGGTGIHYRDITATRSAGAGIYVAAEKEFDSFGVSDTLIEGADLVRSNRQAQSTASARPSPDEPSVVHGAVVVYNSQPDQDITGVTMRDLRIADTTADSSGQVRVTNTSTGTVSGVAFDTVAISGGALAPLLVTGVPESAYRTTAWTIDGQALPPHNVGPG